MRYVAGLALLLLVGMLFGASLLVYAAYILIAVFAISRFLSRKWSDAITVKRTLFASEVTAGDSVQVGVRVENRSGWFIPWMLLEDVLPKRATKLPPIALELEGQPVRLCMLAGKAHRLLSYTLRTTRRGYYQIGPTIAETGDLLGLHRQYRVATPPEYLLVLPRIIPLAGYSISSRRPVGEVKVTYRLMEDPTLISGIREYQPGDSFNRIHWRATARTGKLHSKIFQPTSVAGAMLVLDMHRDSNPDRHEPNRTDLAVSAAVSISHTLYQMQQQFGLISNGRDAVDRVRTEGWESDHRSREDALRSVSMNEQSDRLRPVIVPVGRGPEQFDEILHTLARLERTSGLHLSNLILESQSRLPRDASVIVLVQEVDETTALTLGMLRRQGYAVSAIVNHFEEEAISQAAGRLMAYRIPIYHLHSEESIPEICRSMLLQY